ncbi:hypothetical protein F4805DRAFT_78077 [Annulohypoxylon moriforme]|nr:hypothetical protein F4805DRAFT_78077 [Annulohypoxylon moriforme]
MNHHIAPSVRGWCSSPRVHRYDAGCLAQNPTTPHLSTNYFRGCNLRQSSEGRLIDLYDGTYKAGAGRPLFDYHRQQQATSLWSNLSIMFSTIRYSNVADGPCYLEKTAAPFHRKRHSKPARIACWSCRVSKLRCSGESNGCQRCTGKKIKCHYPEVPDSAPRRLVNAERREPSPSKMSPKTNEDTSGSKIRPCVATDAAPSDLRLARPLATESPTATTECDNSSPGSIHLSLNPESGLAQSFEWPSFLFSNFQNCTDEIMERESDPCIMTEAILDDPGDSGSLAADDILNEEFDLIETRAKDTHPNCSCFERVIYTHEDIEVNLLWRRYNGTGDDNLLQNQKRALADFESLMECGSCTARSAYIMLLISIGRRILDSLDAVDGTAAPAPVTKEQNYDNGDGGGGSRGRKRARKVSIGNWKLDADDELQIYQSLATARATKLAGLVEKLERIARSRNWPAHQDILSEMCEALRKKCMTYVRRIEEISQTLSK